MAVVRQLVPIACANGFAPPPHATQGLVSVYWSPRILTGGVLSAMDEWKDWPAALGMMTVDFITSNGNVPPGSATQLSFPSSTVWNAVFADTMTANAWTSSTRPNDTTFRSFGERAVVEDIMTLYRDIAVNEPLTPPTRAELLDRAIDSTVLAGGGNLGTDLAAARQFQRREGAVPNTKDTEPEWDFHQAVSLLGRHPYLMRLLGLVVDYRVPLLPNTDWIMAHSDYAGVHDPTGPNTVLEIPVRAWVDRATFRPLPLHRTPGDPSTVLGGGFLRLADEDTFGLSELDVTAAITKLVALAREVEGSSSTGALPPLNDAGLSLLRTNRTTALNEQFADDHTLEDILQDEKGNNNLAEINIPVYAEHIRVGYRVDVMRDGEDPLSLFQRKTTKYHFPLTDTDITGVPADEGWVGTSLSVDRVTSGPSVTRLPESLARWRGWSLAAPPRGAVADGTTGGTTRTANTGGSSDHVQFEVDYTVVPGTLPSLRYGSKYQMRARLVDITGNSVPLDTPTPVQAPTSEHIYARLDPLPGPTVVRRDPRSVPGVGDTTARIVIRSNYNTPYASITAAQRLIFPPAASQLTCERHGLPNGGVSGSTADYDLLAGRDGLDVTAQCVPDPVSGEPTAGGAASQTAEYLPDPAGPRLCMTGVPGVSGGVVLAQFAGTWPAWSTRRLVLQGAASGVPTVGAGGGPITVFLPKAGQYEIDLSVAPGTAFDNHFALYHELLDANPGNLALLQSYVRDGRHWMISSRTRIKIVHAVRQPLSIPGFSSLTATRPEVGSRTFSLTGTATLNRASTGRTILTGRWTDPVDDVSEPGPTETSGLVVVGTQKVSLAGAAASAAVSIGHDFMDARRHQIFIRQEAFTRFARDFSEQKSVVVPSLPGTALLDSDGVLAASVLIRSEDGTTTYIKDTDYTLDPAGGTVARIDGGAIGAGSTVLARYVALPLSRMSDEAGAADVEVTVPNAKIPHALPVAAVVPSFIRKTTIKKKLITVAHNPNVVRCYLERPWYDTGIGEKLGVVLDPSSGVLPAVPANTRFARDSLLRVGALPRPVRGHFPLGTHQVADGFHVIGHPVAYDTIRRQWYANVQINAPLGYRAFVQLALARFQPESVVGAHLSRISVADAVLVGARRLVAVKRTKKKLTIAVAGAEHEGRVVAGGPKRFNQVTVSVQGIDTAIADKELRWTERPLGAAEISLSRSRPAGSSTTTWSKALKMRKLAKGKPIRLVITESEPMAGAIGDGANERLVYVPVYTEVIDLPTSWTKKKKNHGNGGDGN